MKIEIIGNLKATEANFKNPQRGRVYLSSGLICCLNGMEFGDNHPKIIEIYENERDERGLPVQGEVHPGMGGGLYDNTTMEFFRGALPGLSRTLKCDDSACVCVEQQIKNDKEMERNYNVFSLEKDGEWGGSGSGGTGDDHGIFIGVQYVDSKHERVMVSTYYASFESMMDKLITSLPGVDNPKVVYEMLVPIYKSVIVAPKIPAWEELPEVLRTPWRKPFKKGRKVYRIRKLTPKECMRLMGVSDEDFGKMKAAGISDSQLYRMAGNSIVIPVLEGIFTQMFREDNECLF